MPPEEGFIVQTCGRLSAALAFLVVFQSIHIVLVSGLLKDL